MSAVHSSRPLPNSPGDDGGGSSTGDDDDATSQGLGAAFTDVSSAAEVDIAADARRTRLLKRLLKVRRAMERLRKRLSRDAGYCRI